LFQKQAIDETAILLRRLSPDVIVVAQGYISICSLGLMAARKVGCAVISYVAITQRMKEVGASLGWIRDMFDRRLFRVPDAFITISQFMKSLLESRGIPSAAISIVRNGVDFSGALPRDRDSARRHCGIPIGSFAVGILGRIKFAHKGHDFFLKTLSRYRRELTNTVVLVVGDGPDKKRLLRLIDKENLEDIVQVLPWTDDMASVYGALDLLALPSRSEGVPLVMLEAMGRGIPVITSKLRELEEFISPQWQFEYGKPASLLATLNRVRYEVDHQRIETNKAFILQHFGITDFGERFYLAMRTHLKSLPSEKKTDGLETR